MNITQKIYTAPVEVHWSLELTMEGDLMILANETLIAYVDPRKGVLELAHLGILDKEEVKGLQFDGNNIKVEA